ncbi:amino acid deaminase/aldolase [Brevibacillus antibioticus]|uniref:Amino acid deaminase/aldolase n=1 Tax=Brevibacillus antibioticus TaxID=2570228 RepID=A0A4V5TQX7_9BACL|nr:amino acid deaminase/aldolase [Brevibacillus antibioticus]TKI58413.1 amino acid deaminase/aldolase [Brevibacillus antibioticus]
MRDYRYYQSAFAGVPKPFAFVDLDLLEENAEQISLQSNGKPVRIASKSIRSVAILKHVLQLDDCFRGLMCYSAPEVLHLCEAGFDDLLLGYPLWEKSWLLSIASEIKNGRSITLMIDSLLHVEQLEQIARETGTRLPVCLDIDMSSDVLGLHFGVWRSPLRSLEASLSLAKRVASSDHLYLDGVMGYEAQIAGVGDRYPRQFLKNSIIRLLKQYSVKEVAARRATLVKAIRELGISLRFVNGGGTGSLHLTGKEDAVTEVTAGSGFFSPGLFDYFQDFRFHPAAGFALEIIRKPKNNIYTCAGGGYIASGSAGRDRLPKPYLPAGSKLFPNEGAGEVQTPIHYQGMETLELGDPIFFRHAKAGELCERFTRLYCISGGKIIEEVTTYRGDGLCSL